MSSYFWAPISTATCIRCSKVGKMMIRYEDVLSLFVNLDKNGSAAKTRAIAHVDERSLFNFSEEDILQMIKAADAFTRTNHKLTTFQENSFYQLAKGLFATLYVCYFEQVREKLPIFALFLDIKIYET